MKRFLSFLMVAGLMAGFAACSDNKEVDNPGNNSGGGNETVTPVFPEVQTLEIIDAGEENGVELEVTGNLDWTVALTNDEDDSFRITDGSVRKSEYTGKAGETLTLTVYALYELGTKGRSCSVMMTMGSESQIIAYVQQGYIEREFAIYTTPFEDGDFVFNPTVGGFDYQELQEGESIELYFPFGNSAYQQHIAIESNFDWELKSIPEWITITNEKTNAETGRYMVDYRARNYKIDEPTGEIVFVDKNDEEAEFVYTVTIPNYGDYIDMIAQNIAEFNCDGQWYNNDSWNDTNPSSLITTTDGYKIFAYSKVSETSGSYYDIDQDWMTITTSESDDDEEDPFIKSIKVSLAVSENKKEEKREGIVLFIPAFVLNPIIEANPGLTDQELAAQFVGAAVAPEYEQYILYYVSQKEYELSPIITAVTPEADLLLHGAYFSNAAKDAWFRTSLNFSNISYFYQLAYSTKISDDNKPMFHLADEYYKTDITFKYYDSAATPMDDDTWLDAEYVEYTDPDAEGTNATPVNVLRIQMNPDKDNYEGFDYDHEGFVMVLSNGTPIACIYCIFDSEFMPEDPDAESKVVEFANPGAVEGAELVKLTARNYADYGISDAEYNEAAGARTALYYLTYTSAEPKNATLTTPPGYWIFVMPYSISWLEAEPGNYDKTSTQMTVKMSAPEEGEQTYGRINIQKSLSGSAIDITIYCKPAFALEE